MKTRLKDAERDLDSASVSPKRGTADSQNDELCWFHWRKANQRNTPSVVDVVLSHRGPIASDKVSLFRLVPHKGAGNEQALEKVFDRLAQHFPKLLIVRLE